jgi:hypothetical protein
MFLEMFKLYVKFKFILKSDINIIPYPQIFRDQAIV